MKVFFKKTLKYLIIGLFWIVIWQILSSIINLPLIFPSPISVIYRFGQLLLSIDFYHKTFFSFIRIFIGILIAVFSASFLAFICSLNKFIYDIFVPLISIMKSTPVVAFVFLVNIFIGSSKTVVFICFLMVFPIVFSNVYQGIVSTDKDLLELSKVYKIPFSKRLFALYLPSISPYFASSLLSSIGLAWKAGVAAEILCTPQISIGIEIFNSKTYFEYIDLFAWILTVVVLSMALEFITNKMLKIVLKKKQLSMGL